MSSRRGDGRRTRASVCADVYVSGSVSSWRHERQAVSKRSWRSSTSAVAVATAPRHRRLNVGEHALREFAQTSDRLERRGRLSDRAGVHSGRHQPSHDPGLGDRPLEPIAHEIRLPAGQLDQPLERNTGLCRAPERERDEVNGTADDLDRDVLAGLRAARAPASRRRPRGDARPRPRAAARPRRACPRTTLRRSGTASRHPVAAAAPGGVRAAPEPTLPPSLVQRSASRRASALARSSNSRDDLPPAITRSVARGPSSDTHTAPQRQHAPSWRAIGARQEWHNRATCRSRMAQRSFPRADRSVGASAGSIEGRLFRR